MADEMKYTLLHTVVVEESWEMSDESCIFAKCDGY